MGMDFLDAQIAGEFCKDEMFRHRTIDTIFADVELCIEKFELLLDDLRTTNRFPEESEQVKTALLHRLAGLAEKVAAEIDMHAYLLRSGESWLTHYLNCIAIIMQANESAQDCYDLSEQDRAEISEFKDYLSRYTPTLSPDQRDLIRRFGLWYESLNEMDQMRPDK